MERNKTWEIVDKLSDYGTMMQMDVQSKLWEGIALVAKMNIVKKDYSLIGSSLGWELQQFEVKNAFLHGDL